MKYNFDVIIIGGGAAGLFAASVANALGAKTALIEKDKLGGDCTWFGCVPSKALLKSAYVANLLNKSNEFGLNLKGDFSLGNGGVMEHVRGVVQEISTHHPAEVFQKRGIKVIFGAPKFLDNNTIKVGQDDLKAKKFIVCTGSRPVVPQIEGIEDIDYLTNEAVFGLEELPQSLVVLGAGPIGLELAQGLNRLGVKVFVVEMMDTVLFKEDEEISKFIEKALLEENLGILTGKKVIKFEKKEGKSCVIFESKDGHRGELAADKVLIAVGRTPGIKGLDLEKAGIKYTKKGIEVNSYLQTTSKNIFACGDVVGPYMFSHVAAYQASICVRNALLRKISWQKASYGNIAWATFTDPEVSRLGLTEPEARKKHKSIKVYKSQYKECDRAVTDSEKEGLVKIITDKKGFILGAHIVGSKGSEIIQGLLVAKANKLPLSKIASVLFIYPTLSELIKKISAKALVEKLNNPLVKIALKLLKKI